MGCLDDVVQWMKSNWNKITHGPDPNPSDMLYLAIKIEEQCHIAISECALSVDEAKIVLDQVGDYLLDKGRVTARNSNPIIRKRSTKQLIDELRTLQSILEGLPIANLGRGERALVRTLYLYGSYLLTAKSCSQLDSSGEPIDRTISLSNYNMLAEVSERNSWIRAGVIFVRLLRPNQPMVDDWIPSGSIYWEEL